MYKYKYLYIYNTQSILYIFHGLDSRLWNRGLGLISAAPNTDLGGIAL